MNTQASLRLCLVAALAVALTWTPGECSSEDVVDQDWSELSLEELAGLPVMLVSRKEETVWQAPAAVHVIARDDLLRSGVTSIPEGLRMIPGVQVSRIDANTWAISARGFVDRFANKLLVLIDGRSVYTPLFSGVMWDAQDVALDDVERIEVIRGPGATLWGANAVNGVINVITRDAANTQGTSARVGFGDEERGFVNMRYGGKLGAAGHYRIYGKFFERNSSMDRLGNSAGDGWSGVRSGFRVDAQRSASDRVSLQSDFLRNEIDQTRPLSPSGELARSTATDEGLTTFNMLGRWRRTPAGSAASELQVYFDHIDRRDLLLEERRSTVDVDFQHRKLVDTRNELVWGAGYRRSWDDLSGFSSLAFTPPSRTMQLFSVFFQDDIALIDEQLRFVVGAKLERHEFTSFEFQPNVRAWWNPGAGRHVVWAAASRAKRTPSRMDHDGHRAVRGRRRERSEEPPTPPSRPRMEAENLNAFEAGYRWRPAPRLFFETTAFHHSYERLIGSELNPDSGFSPAVSDTILQAFLAQDLSTMGAEFHAIWRMSERATLSGGYSYLDYDILFPADRTAAHLAFARLALDPIRRVDADAMLRHVGRLSPGTTDRYTELDVRVAWEITAGTEVSVIGQNLLHDSHAEYRPTSVRVAETLVPRGVHASLRWRR